MCLSKKTHWFCLLYRNSRYNYDPIETSGDESIEDFIASGDSDSTGSDEDSSTKVCDIYCEDALSSYQGSVVVEQASVLVEQG